MSSLAKPPSRSLGTLIGGASYGRAFRRIEAALDADAAKYLAAVEAADKQVLEDGVKRAVSVFVRACKADGNWDAIKASCILCGARTLAGALVPLKGTAPTNYNFVGLGTDYTRADGLQGDGSTKYLDSNRANDDDPQDNSHLSVYRSVASSETASLIGVTEDSPEVRSNLVVAFVSSTSYFYPRVNNSTGSLANSVGSVSGFFGASRSSSASYSYKRSGFTAGAFSVSSAAPTSRACYIFGNNDSGSPSLFSSSTIAFYSIGEAVDLAALDTAVSTLVSEIGAAV